ncbi:ARF GAP with effector function(s) [Malassezia brasiliensis]|uniref:ARF GAP with effector function(S) n=1 Tax=Malassezia brasiliensis TaxID=1821822 RepID=A0AAF0IRM6_9BASI|nr:ARF GAP with effector function(s) [Malassezia brasiliensis]
MSYAARKPQSRAEAEANARTLRSLVKLPDNKVCADCKRNDTRWASWNIGCFLCIRCSGVHRSMGTHISRVKSIDLDMWTAEQMESVQRWGNRRVNLYWEANLKPGHIPPDHKIESFIRSKRTPAASNALLDFLSDDPAPTPAAASAPVATTTTAAAPVASSAASSASKARGGGLFDLDWDENPVQASAPAPAKTGKGKEDILSLFSAPPPTRQPDTLFATPAAPAADLRSGTAATPRAGGSDIFNTQDIWGAPASTDPPKPSANDAFADIWGEFK